MAVNRPANIELIIWDWNGTLLDDVDACVAAMNSMLTRRGLARLDRKRYQDVFGFPVIDYYRALGFDLDSEPFAGLADEFVRHYRKATKTAYLHPGASAVLEAFRDSGHTQIVLSATETTELRRQIAAQGVLAYFDHLIGADNIQANGKIDCGRAYFRNRPDLDPAAAVLLGDTYHDYEVSRALGCRCVLVKNGHQDLDRFRFSSKTFIADDLPAVRSLLIQPRHVQRHAESKNLIIQKRSFWILPGSSGFYPFG